MTDAFIGEIRMFSGNFSPEFWFFCAGQPLAISQFSALFSILGTTYGGNGRTDFNLPDLRGRVPIGGGNSQGPGVDRNFLGEFGGWANKQVSNLNMPSHSHEVHAAKQDADQQAPSTSAVPGIAYRGVGPVPKRQKEMHATQDQATMKPLNPLAVGLAGPQTGDPIVFDNYQPFLTSGFIICYEGIYPPRN